MPPKKNAENIASSAKASKARAPRKKGVKEKVEKPKLKTPTIVKMKLPSIKSFLQNTAPTKCKNKGKDPPEINPALQRKMDLANEVALAQLVKPNNLTVTKFVAENTDKKRIVKRQTKPRTEPPKPRGRQKGSKNKVAVVEAPAPNLIAEESASEPEVLPKKKRAYVRKKPPIKKMPESECKVANSNQKALADSTSIEVKVTRKYNKKTKDPIRNDSEHDVENTVKKPEAPNTPEKKPRRKGKNKESANDLDQSPSLLQQASKMLENRLLEPETTQPNESKTICTPIDSRKTSTSECLSWTKDISSSSTTTCMTVGSNDLIKVGKKLPVLRLSNIGNEWKKVTDNKIPDEAEDHAAKSPSSSSSSESSDSSSSSSSSLSTDDQSSSNSKRGSLNLSTSSISPSKSFVTHTSLTIDEDWEYALKKVSANLRRLDIEAINWEGYQNVPVDRNINIIQDKIFKLLKFENQVLKECNDIKNFLRTDKKSTENKENHQDTQLPAEVDPNLDTDRSEDDNFKSTQSKYVMLNQTSTPEENALVVCNNEKDNSDEEKVAEDKLLYDQGDDDDAISIYAESLTGLESSRYESSANSICANASDHEEYVPPMISQERPEPFPYIPTKIYDEPSIAQNYRNKTICEKQNADSTSLFARDNEHYKNIGQTIDSGSKPNPSTSQTVIRPYPFNPPPPRLDERPLFIHQVYKPLICTKSTVFRGVCFFNLISNCRKMNCEYPHIEMDQVEVCNRLSKLTEELFVQEYMVVRRWPDLRRRYGMLYVTECLQRNLTRVLVEMAHDFITKAKKNSVEDRNLKTIVCEKVLLHLNDKDLGLCEDFLRYNLGYNKNFLCLNFLRTIGESQNFTRFKPIFVKLTNYVKELGLTFDLDVANLILERVSILPFDESLARAMCTIILNADIRIFEHPMISRFESQISMLDQVTCEQYFIAKDNAILKLKGPQVNEKVSSPKINQEIDMNPTHGSREERYTSPDTTKMDNSNKGIEEKRTPQKVQMIRPPMFGRPNSTHPNISNDPQRLTNSTYPNTSNGPQRLSNSTYQNGPQSNSSHTVVSNGPQRQPNFTHPNTSNGPQRLDNECTENRPKYRSRWGNRDIPQYNNNNMGNMGNNRYNNGYMRGMRPPPLKRRPDQRLVAFGAPPPKFLRRNGPRF